METSSSLLWISVSLGAKLFGSGEVASWRLLSLMASLLVVGASGRAREGPRRMRKGKKNFIMVVLRREGYRFECQGS